MSAAATSKDSAALCADLVRTHDFARYASTLFLPQAERRALLAVYAFNVEISRVREQVSQPLPGEMRLQWWTDMLEGAGHGGVEGNPVAAELLQTIREFRLPVEPLSRLIEEHQFDLYNDPMPSMAALEGYVTDTSVGAVSAWRADRSAAVGRDRPSRAPCRPGPGHGAGDRGAAARCRAAPAIPAAAIAAATRQRDGGSIFGQADAEGARRDRPAGGRRPKASRAPPSSCSRMCRRRRGRYSCRWRWSAAI